MSDIFVIIMHIQGQGNDNGWFMPYEMHGPFETMDTASSYALALGPGPSTREQWVAMAVTVKAQDPDFQGPSGSGTYYALINRATGDMGSFPILTPTVWGPFDSQGASRYLFYERNRYPTGIAAEVVLRPKPPRN